MVPQERVSPHTRARPENHSALLAHLFRNADFSIDLSASLSVSLYALLVLSLVSIRDGTVEASIWRPAGLRGLRLKHPPSEVEVEVELVRPRSTFPGFLISELDLYI